MTGEKKENQTQNNNTNNNSAKPKNNNYKYKKNYNNNNHKNNDSQQKGKQQNNPNKNSTNQYKPKNGGNNQNKNFTPKNKKPQNKEVVNTVKEEKKTVEIPVEKDKVVETQKKDFKVEVNKPESKEEVKVVSSEEPKDLNTIHETPLPPMRKSSVDILPPIKKGTPVFVPEPLDEKDEIFDESKIKQEIPNITTDVLEDYEKESFENEMNFEEVPMLEEPIEVLQETDDSVYVVPEPIEEPMKPIAPIREPLKTKPPVKEPEIRAEEPQVKEEKPKKAQPVKKKKDSSLKRNLIIWGIVLLVIAGFLGFYFYSKSSTTPEVTETKDSKTVYENLLEMDYEVVDYEETADGIVLKLKGAFRDSDIISFQNKLINLVKKQNVKVYFFENSAINYDFLGANTPDLIAFTETDFDEFNMKFNKYQELPNIETSNTLNKYNIGEITTEDGLLTITMEMDVDVEDLSSVVSNAKAFIDLFKRTNSDKNIEDVKLNLVIDDTLVYSYNTQESNYLMIQEIKTFSKQ